jgi:hypothetical protein
MSFEGQDMIQTGDCTAVRGEFSAYLDGAVSGVEMTAIAAHLEDCADCSQEFAAWRTVQQSLGELGPAKPPMRLQARLRAALAFERERGTHLSFGPRALLFWESSVAPIALRVAGGLAVAALLLGSFGWMYAPLAVQANDDNMAHLVGPSYLYSEVPPQPVDTRRDVPIVVEAKVDTMGRVYDYAILEGPTDVSVQVRVEENLLASVFKPATVFGVPVRGHVVLTYTGVSVRG